MCSMRLPSGYKPGCQNDGTDIKQHQEREWVRADYRRYNRLILGALCSIRTSDLFHCNVRAGRPPLPGQSTMASSDRKESGVSPAALLEFFLICGRLKTTKRAGWVQQGVHQPESVADHMYRMGMMALAFDGEPGHSGERLDFSKVVRMAIVHDLAESIVGDITPSDNVPEDKKHEMEESAMREITEDLGDAGRMIYDLFVEYERGQTPEAKLVKDFDKLDMIVQAFEYERSQGSTLEQFFESTRGRFTHPKIKRVVEILYERRKHECTHE